MIPLLLMFAGLGSSTALADGLRPATPREAEFFEARVRPVLVEHCQSCHGSTKQRSGLRLDSGAAVFRGGDGGPAIVPGDPDNSPLIEAIRHDGPTPMPPKPRSKLPDRAVADLTAWVKMGAPWPATAAASDPTAEAWKRHWAFQPVADPAPPAVRDERWCRTSIDRFLLARLESRGLTPSSQTDRRTLIRRATFDLIGLPPTPEEVEAFLADDSTEAFARVVDRLLASPHYGERWGRHWLDVARYADTKGYVFFEEANFPWSYTYRDWVVRVLNEDLPYDQFLVQQLAADRLPLGDDKRPLAALGFLTLGGRFMNNEHDIIDDRIDVVTRGLMGLTVACARCHDHKFDPVPTRDYYALYGVFASSVEPTVPPLFEPTPTTKDYVVFAKELEIRERRLAEFLAAKHEALVTSARSRVAEYLLAAHAAREHPTTDEFMLIADGGDLNPRMLVRWRTYLEQTRRPRHPVFGTWHALAALPEKEFASKAKDVVARLVAEGPVNPLVAEAFAAAPKSLEEAAHTYARLLHRIEWIGQDYARRAALNGAPATALPDPALDELRRVFHGPNAPPDVPPGTLSDLDLLPDRPSQQQVQELRKAIETWRASGLGAPPRAMVLEDAPRPVEPRVFLRGNPNNPGPAVPRQFLGVLTGERPTPFREGSGRLELARAIVDPANPLTARVLVNRVWLQHFGAPLVGTPSDFGLRSEPPSHPELLDHLARRFVNDGWSLKRLHREMMLSSAYQQASDDRPECRRVDPENALLGRMNRRRLDFESTRDALLAVSGRLDRTIGGPPVKEIAAPTATRRTLYGFVDRLNLPGLYRAFDFPDPNTTSPRRDATTIAPQALFLMNHPLAIESARAVRKRPEIAGAAEAAETVDRLYRLCFGRRPSAEELALAREFLGSPPESASWDSYVQGLLMSNEFVFVD